MRLWDELPHGGLEIGKSGFDSQHLHIYVTPIGVATHSMALMYITVIQNYDQRGETLEVYTYYPLEACQLPRAGEDELTM